MELAQTQRAISAPETPETFKFCGGNLLKRLGRLTLSLALLTCLWFSPTPTDGTRAVPIHEDHDKAAKRLRETPLPDDEPSVRLLRDANTIADALRLCLPADVLADIDLDSLRLLPTEHVDADLRRHRGDLLWTARLRSGGAVLIPIEAQSTAARNMAARMMTLTDMSYEGIAASLEVDGRLPAVLHIVLYTGQRPWAAARDLAELAHPLPGFAPYIDGPHYVQPALRSA